MATDMSLLPELCYAIIDGNAPGERIGIIKRGEKGYYLTDFDTSTASEETVREVVDKQNRMMGVLPSQAMAMKIGSMMGWHVPGANPENFRNLDKGV